MKVQVIEVPHTRNKHMRDYEVLSRRSIELAFRLRLFKQDNDLSWQQVTNIANVYAKRYNVKFYQGDFSSYASFKKIPSEKHMNALLDMMNLTLPELVSYVGTY